MAELVGNCLVAQSGGPTAVINASVAGVITEALNHNCIEEVYGGLNGVLGILNEEFIDLAAESQQQVRALRSTPGAALGTCRYKLKKQQDFERVLEVFKAHSIRYFFYCGGNDSQDTADKISKLAEAQGYELRVIGVPKTIDNDLAGDRPLPRLRQRGQVHLRHRARTGLRQRGHGPERPRLHPRGHGPQRGVDRRGLGPGQAPRPSLRPARTSFICRRSPFSVEKFVEDVRRVLKREKYCLIVVGEGLVDKDGNYSPPTAPPRMRSATPSSAAPPNT